jgi:hypothetical protein
MRADRTIERSYLRQWRRLIAEYDAVRSGKSTAFSNVRDFYAHHGTCSQTFRKYYNRHSVSGLATDLLPRRRGPKHRLESVAEAAQAKEAVFKILHSPPSDFGFNRATWKRADLQQALKSTGVMLSKRNIQSIIKAAGYRWLKAKQMLTSKDPEYRTRPCTHKPCDDVRHVRFAPTAAERNMSRWANSRPDWAYRYRPLSGASNTMGILTSTAL